MKEKIASVFSRVSGIPKEEALKLVEVPKDLSLGDYAIPCFSLSKVLRKNPNEIAIDISSKIKDNSFEKVQAVGPYVNFFMDRRQIATKILKEIQSKKDKYGSSSIGKGKRALVEHTSINPNASPHVGRARNALIGDSIVRILRFQGFKVD